MTKGCTLSQSYNTQIPQNQGFWGIDALSLNICLLRYAEYENNEHDNFYDIAEKRNDLCRKYMNIRFFVVLFA